MALLTQSKLIAISLLVTVHLAASNKPVFETINEQDRMDSDIRVSNAPGILPYGNPLAGNSKQNARIHANNQQAMFNAERMRQHKAQLQRWTKGPPIIDSYMKAYHDSQENHQLALEQQQATLKDDPVTKAPATRTKGRPLRQRIVQNKKVVSNSENSLKAAQNGPSTPPNRIHKQRQELPRRGSFLQTSEPIKITKADVVNDARNRNHRSYGSTDYQNQNLETKRYKTAYESPSSSYDHGVIVNPNNNNGLAQVSKEPSDFYTAKIYDNAEYAYAKHSQHIKSTQDIEALNSLLKKNPTEQLSEFKALLNPDKNAEDITKGVPVDFYFYLKDPSKQTLSEDNNNLKRTQLPSSYESPYIHKPVKDYTPITEEVDDIEDPNKDSRTLNTQFVATIAPELETTTTKSNNYYKVEVASQTISAGIKPKHIKEEYYVKQEADPHYESLTYGYHPYYNHEVADGKSEIYLHHNAEPTGVQHLLEDGTETSAFGDDNLQYAANYDFGYRVRDQDSGNYFGHRESKKGESTKGAYHVLLPDGRMQLVNYSAGPSGFHADISYEHLQ